MFLDRKRSGPHHCSDCYTHEANSSPSPAAQHRKGRSHWPVRGMMMMKQPLPASWRMRFRWWQRAAASGTRYGDMDDWALGCWRLPSSCDTSNCKDRTEIETQQLMMGDKCEVFEGSATAANLSEMDTGWITRNPEVSKDWGCINLESKLSHVPH